MLIAARIALGNGMEEVVGSIPTRSTKSPNRLDKANGRDRGVGLTVVGGIRWEKDKFSGLACALRDLGLIGSLVYWLGWV